MNLKIGIILISFMIAVVSTAKAEMIDGPAVIFEKINGAKIGMLDDGAPVRVVSQNSGWIELELKFNGAVDLLKGPLKQKLNLSRKIYGTYGYINPGANLKVKNVKGTFLITVYTVAGNLKEKVLYYKNYKAFEKDINIYNFNFSESVPLNKASAEIAKYETSESIPDELNGTGLFSEVGYYRGIPTVVRSFVFTSFAGGSTELKVQDSYFINERGLLKSYNTGNVLIKNAVCHYYKEGSFRIFKAEYDINAPLSYEAICTYIITAGNNKYEVSFTLKMNNDMKKYINAVSIVKYSGTGIDFTYRVEAKITEDVLKIFKTNSAYSEITSLRSGINFDQEIQWLKTTSGN
jgi:hypothetical protein